jgi:hypothetical protein
VPEHSLPDGRRWIESLLDLGRALGYRAEPEFDVTPSEPEEAPVDIAWLTSEDDRFPLFIFEVESQPTGQMTHNAAKVFGQDTALFQKPLFHFHLVLKGGQTSGRITAVSELFGKFNYRVYRVAEDGATDALRDIVSQHRRVRSTIDVMALSQALAPSRWQDVDIDQVWMHIETARFNAPWARRYAQLALSEEAFLPRLARILAADADCEAHIDPRQYGTFAAQHSAPLLHAAILAQQHPERAAECFERARSLQGEGDSRAFAPHYGLSQDYDGLIFSIMPAVWALLAASLRDVEGARVWVLEQMEIVIAPQSRIPFVLSALTAVWMLHVAAHGGEETRAFYDQAAAMLNDGSGVSPQVLASPPMMGGNHADLDPWWEVLMTDATPVGNVEQFQPAGRGDEPGGLTALTLRYLLEDLSPNDSPALVAALR